MSKKKADLTSELISEVDSHGSSHSSRSSRSSKSSRSSHSDKDSYDDGKSVQSVKITKEFQENVLKFVKLDDLIRKHQEELAELKKQKKPYEQHILKELDKINQTTISISDGKLRRNKSETKTALNQDVIKSAIFEKVKDPQLVEEILKTMDEKRQVTTHVNIKRTGGKRKKRAKK